MNSLDESSRKDFAKKLNFLKDDMSSKIDLKFKQIEQGEINKKLENEKVDNSSNKISNEW